MRSQTAKIAYFDCFHGAAGDMLLASLLDAGLGLAALEQALTLVPITGYGLEWSRALNHHISGSRLLVRVDQAQPTRSWADIRDMLEHCALPTRSRNWALGAFKRLAYAEAAIHGTPVEQTHFHEVGAIDSIVDIVGFCVGLELMEIERIYASALPLGQGWVHTCHGFLPVPAPATLGLLAEVGAPILPTLSKGELVTPTAAALLAELAHFEQPAMRIRRVGYGFGRKEFDRVNGLRVWLGEPFAPTSIPTDDDRQLAPHAGNHSHTHIHNLNVPISTIGSADQHPIVETVETVVELCCNLDDVTGEIAAYTIERLLDAGALDAWTTPLVMKKGRPAVQLACLARPNAVETLIKLIVRETPTLGVRWQTMERFAAERQIVKVNTPWGPVRVKHKLIDGVVISGAPEYEDCAALARAHQAPLAQIYAAALRGIIADTALDSAATLAED